jgi:hypothetical protein
MDNFLRLLFRAHEKYILALGGNFEQKIFGGIKTSFGLFQVDDVDTASLAEDELFHFGIPARSLMAKMYPRFQQLFD